MGRGNRQDGYLGKQLLPVFEALYITLQAAIQVLLLMQLSCH